MTIRYFPRKTRGRYVVGLDSNEVGRITGGRFVPRKNAKIAKPVITLIRATAPQLR
jgi:hypothetical protein